MQGEDKVFDEMVRQQFAGETTTPPASVEADVFAALDRSTVAKSWGRAAGVVLVAAAMAVGVWNLNSDQSPDVSPASASPASTATDTPSHESTHEPTLVAVPMPVAIDTPEASAVPHGALTTTGALASEPHSDVAPLEALAAEEIQTNTPDSNELKESAGESWVIPAHIEVEE